MTTGKWVDDAGQTVWIDRVSMCHLIQSQLLADHDIEQIDTLLKSVAKTREIAGQQETEEGTVVYSPWTVLNDLFANQAEFYEDHEARCLDQEEQILRDHAADSIAPEKKTYTVTQTFHIAHTGLPDHGALHLWLPAPRHVAKVQHVKLIRTEPDALARHYLGTAGQFYNTPVLLDSRTPLPVFTAEFEVEQYLPGFYEYRDPGLTQRNHHLDQDDLDALIDWMLVTPINRVDVDETGTADDDARLIVRAFIDKMEDSFKYVFTPMGAGPFRGLLDRGSGNIFELTEFLAAALRQNGFGARVERALAMPGDAGSATFNFPESAGYEHAFLSWRHPETNAHGIVDLNYWRRWSFAATQNNTRSAAFRERLQRVGELGRRHLRDRLYPGPMILGGSVPQSQVRFLDTGATHQLDAPVRTEITVQRAH